MRVYEFAKKAGVSSKELVKFLNEHGFSIKSHMSVLTDDACSFLNKNFRLTEDREIKKDIPSPQDEKKTEKPKTMQKEPVQKKVSEPYVEKVVQPSFELTIKPMTLSEVSQHINQPVNDIILQLLRLGIMATRNQLLDEEIVAKIADIYEVPRTQPVRASSEKLLVASSEGDLTERLPVVVVLGHIDHGKTTLLDFIRKSRVAHREKGGITQHLGAYEAKTSQGNIVFLDTPGHEAFPRIRQRGVRVADIAILVVAADDGVMPQTVEAIKVIKDMNVPVVVAVNKIDRVDPARIEVIKQQLSQYDILPEEWGGSAIFVPISAKTGQGVDNLLEMIALQAEMMELRTNIDTLGRGYVLESRLEKGRGPVATLILQSGTISQGDYFLCGSTFGRVSTLMDSSLKRAIKAGPSIPIVVAGFEALPEVGDYLEVISKEEYREKRRHFDAIQKTNLAYQPTREGRINLVLKADTDSTKEALVDAIAKISQKNEVGFNIISASIGNINESDIELAFNTGSRIIGLHVKVESNAAALRQRRSVRVELFDIIYRILELLEKEAVQSREVKFERVKTGDAIVRRVFKIKGIGVIAGSYVQNGTITKDGHVVAWRGKQKIGEGKILSLQREKKTVKEVHTGYECGFVVDGIEDWAIDDHIECFIDRPISN